MSRILIVRTAIAVTACILAIAQAPAVAAATPLEEINAQAEAARGATAYSTVSDSSGAIPTTVAKIVNGSLALLGAIFFGLMVYAGYLWMTSRDESDQVDKAKETMRRAVIGLIIVLAAYAISKFITVAIQKGTGT